MRRLLFVDDDPDVRLMARFQLEVPETEFLEAHDGPSAIAMAQEHTPDVVVLDMQMPDMLGTEVARTLLAQGFEGALMIFSAHFNDELRAELAEMGLPAINKTELRDLRRAVQAALDG